MIGKLELDLYTIEVVLCSRKFYIRIKSIKSDAGLQLHI